MQCSALPALFGLSRHVVGAVVTSVCVSVCGAVLNVYLSDIPISINRNYINSNAVEFENYKLNLLTFTYFEPDPGV